MVRLSDSEWRIMSALWEKPMTITELTAALAEETGWSKHTIISFLHRMEEKNAVRFEQGIRAKRYYPVADRQEAQLEETSQFLDRCFSGKIGLLLNAMLSAKRLSREEIDELSDILQQAEADAK
jgi:BlaI family penicillinase repressor